MITWLPILQTQAWLLLSDLQIFLFCATSGFCFSFKNQYVEICVYKSITLSVFKVSDAMEDQSQINSMFFEKLQWASSAAEWFQSAMNSAASALITHQYKKEKSNQTENLSSYLLEIYKMWKTKTQPVRIKGLRSHVSQHYIKLETDSFGCWKRLSIPDQVLRFISKGVAFWNEVSRFYNLVTLRMEIPFSFEE